MIGEFIVYDKLTHDVIGVGTIRELSKCCGISYSSLLEHYRDRNNTHRFISCNWGIEERDIFTKEYSKWKLME